MFVAEVFPLWAWIVGGVSLVLTIILTIAAITGKGSRVFPVITAFLLSATSMFAIILPAHETYSNPYHDISGVRATKHDYAEKEEINNFIKEAIDAETVSAKLGEDEDSATAKDARSGEIFEFVAIEDGATINGSFYFTDETMEIIVESETENKEQISVSTN